MIFNSIRPSFTFPYLDIGFIYHYTFFGITKFSKIIFKNLSKFPKYIQNKCKFRKYFRNFCNVEKMSMVDEVTRRSMCSLLIGLDGILVKLQRIINCKNFFTLTNFSLSLEFLTLNHAILAKLTKLHQINPEIKLLLSRN